MIPGATNLACSHVVRHWRWFVRSTAGVAAALAALVTLAAVMTHRAQSELVATLDRDGVSVAQADAGFVAWEQGATVRAAALAAAMVVIVSVSYVLVLARGAGVSRRAALRRAGASWLAAVLVAAAAGCAVVAGPGTVEGPVGHVARWIGVATLVPIAWLAPMSWAGRIAPGAPAISGQLRRRPVSVVRETAGVVALVAYVVVIATCASALLPSLVGWVVPGTAAELVGDIVAMAGLAVAGVLHAMACGVWNEARRHFGALDDWSGAVAAAVAAHGADGMDDELDDRGAQAA